MNTENVNYTELSTTMIRELLAYDNKISANSFKQLTYNKNIKYFKYSENNNVILTLLDNSNITVTIEKR